MLKHLVTTAALLVLINACGSSSDSPKRSETPQQTETNTVMPGSTVEKPVQTSADAITTTPADASFIQTFGPDGGSAIACAYNINGKLSEGKTKEECDKLKKEFEKAVGTAAVPSAPSTGGTSSQVACSFNINGKLYEGKSQAECDKLKKDLGITLSIPSLPSTPKAPAQTPVPSTPSAGTVTDVACAFNVNGKLYEGKTQEECDKLKKDLGISF